jgi:hypothetical protein
VTETLLVNLVRRQARTFLQYVREAFPWTTAGAEAAREELFRMAAAEEAAVDRIGRWLQRRRAPVPPPDPYPMDFTDWNFVALDALWRKLVAEQRKAIADVERTLTALADPQARDLVRQLLALKQTHLQALQELAAAVPAAAGH